MSVSIEFKRSESRSDGTELSNQGVPKAGGHLGDTLNDGVHGECRGWHLVLVFVVVVGEKIFVDDDNIGSVDLVKHTRRTEHADTRQELSLVQVVVVVLVDVVPDAECCFGHLEQGHALVEGVRGLLLRQDAIVVQVIFVEGGHDLGVGQIVEQVDFSDCIDEVVALDLSHISVHVGLIEGLPKALKVIL